jgi:hypothetical protein
LPAVLEGRDEGFSATIDGPVDGGVDPPPGESLGANDPGEPPPPWARRVAAALRVTTGAPEPPWALAPAAAVDGRNGMTGVEAGGGGAWTRAV